MRSVARSRDFRDLGLEPLEMWKKCGWNWREGQIWECGCIWNNEQDELEYWKLRFRNMKFEVGIFQIWNSCYCSLELLGGLPSLGSLQGRGYRKSSLETLWERYLEIKSEDLFFLENFTSETMQISSNLQISLVFSDSTFTQGCSVRRLHGSEPRISSSPWCTWCAKAAIVRWQVGQVGFFPARVFEGSMHWCFQQLPPLKMKECPP